MNCNTVLSEIYFDYNLITLSNVKHFLLSQVLNHKQNHLFDHKFNALNHKNSDYSYN